jgi:hypothetical protein
LLRLIARIAIKPATMTGEITASEAPQTTISASPRRMRSKPRPIVSVPEVQASAGVADGPCMPSWMFT